MIHTTFYTGSKIRIVLRGGRVVIAKYKQKVGDKKIRTFDQGDFNIIDIRSVGYYKPLPHEL